MNQKYPIKAFDGTNTTDVQVLNVPAESVGENGEVNLNAGVKVYRALLSQTGTDAPVATVLENTLGGVPLWEYDSTGNYNATLVGAFTDGKTCLSIGPCNSFLMYVFTPGNEDVVSLSINNQAGDAVDDVLFNNYVHILVYP